MKKINWGYVVTGIVIGGLLVLLVVLRQAQYQTDSRLDDKSTLPIVDSRPSPVLGLREARLRTGERVYVSAVSGEFFLVGNLFQVTPKGVVNLTEVAQRQDRLADLAAAPQESFLTFAAASDEQAVVTVFTDISCAYCQLFHQEVVRLNELGITVRYLAFPREGLRSATASQMAAVWCGSQPHDALGQAFQGMGMPSASDQGRCGDAVSRGFELGQRMGVRGTPAIVLPNGELGAGYLSAEQLAEAVRVSQIEEPFL